MDSNSDPKSSDDRPKESDQKRETTQKTDENNSWSSTSWWSSIVQKSTDTFESIKRDLSEFKDTVQNESVSVVSNTATYVSQTMKDTITGITQTLDPEFESTSDQKPEGMPQNHDISSSKEEVKQPEDQESKAKSSDDWTSNLKNKAKHTFSELVSSIADAFVMNRDYYEDEDEMYVFCGDQLIAIDNWSQLLAEIQNDFKTYCHEPSGPPEHYESWLMTFNLFDYQRQMDHLLKSVPKMQEFYSQLVPNSLSDVEFWHRYYYRVHQLRQTERKKIEDKSRDSKDLTEVSEALNRSSVEVKLLEENSCLSSTQLQQIKEEMVSNPNIESSDLQSIRSSPDSSDTHKSETGSDDWEKTDVVSDEDIKDWVKCD